MTSKRPASAAPAGGPEQDILELVPLGAGQEVGRSCVYMSYKGKVITGEGSAEGLPRGRGRMGGDMLPPPGAPEEAVRLGNPDFRLAATDREGRLTLGTAAAAKTACR